MHVGVGGNCQYVAKIQFVEAPKSEINDQWMAVKAPLCKPKLVPGRIPQ
jgi:hypothetical protein